MITTISLNGWFRLKENMRNQLLVLTGLIILATSLYFYNQKNRTPLAVKLKVDLLANKKKITKSWKQVKTSVITKKGPTKATTTSSLAQELEVNLQNVRVEKLKNINNAIKIADELISREPNSYSAYKAKLILLLTKESKHSQSIDDTEIEQLLQTMAGFDVMTEQGLKREAFLIARSNSKLDGIEALVQEMELELEELEEIEEEDEPFLDPELELEIELMVMRINEQLNLAEEIEEDLEQDLIINEKYLNEDLVEIPFYRALAKKEFDNVIFSAEALLEAYPDSISAHFFLVRALELKGESQAAIEFLRNSDLPDAESREVERRLSSSRHTNPLDYWKRLRF